MSPPQALQGDHHWGEGGGDGQALPPKDPVGQYHHNSGRDPKAVFDPGHLDSLPIKTFPISDQGAASF